MMCSLNSITHFANRTIVAVADGCNWGKEPRDAARKATKIFTEYLMKHQKDIVTARDVGYLVLRAYLAAHNSIIEGRTQETLFQAGTTTMLAGLVLELEHAQWGFVCVSLGDCKAFRWSAKTGEVRDATEGNRGNITDARDPGGRLGPYLEGGAPDLRNLSVFWIPCEQGDVIAILSDGVHDNFDPQHLGKTPKDLNITLKDNNWAELENVKDPTLFAEAEKVKLLFTHKFINAMLGGEKSLRSESRTEPSMITRTVTQHCLKMTQASRDFMEQNPGKKLDKDFVLYPGKMDHATCVAFKVGLKTLPNSEKGGMATHLPSAKLRIPPQHNSSNKDISAFWIECKTEDTGEKYFYNSVTKESCWEDPTTINTEWKVYYDDKHERYWHNIKTGETSWERPTIINGSVAD